MRMRRRNVNLVPRLAPFACVQPGGLGDNDDDDKDDSGGGTWPVETLRV